MDLRTRSGGVERAWLGRAWPVGPVALITGEDEVALRRGPFGRWLEPSANAPPQLQRVQLANKLARLRGALDALGGVFVVTDEQEGAYRDLTDPTYGEGLVRAALQIDLNKPPAVTDFVTTYGWLDRRYTEMGVWGTVCEAVGENLLLYSEGKSRRLRGSLVETTRMLKTFRGHMEWLQRLKSKPAVERDWAEFAEALTPFVSRIHPTIRWDRATGARPCWTVMTPNDVLWASLWDWTTRGGELLRCRRCNVLFPADHPRQKFCSRTCTNRASAAAWYRKRGRAQRRAARLG